MQARPDLKKVFRRISAGLGRTDQRGLAVVVEGRVDVAAGRAAQQGRQRAVPEKYVKKR